MIQSSIIDGDGNGNKLRINKEGDVTVSVHTHPPLNEEIIALPFRAYFTDTAGSKDMLVDGSTVPVVYSIDADPELDVFIKTAQIKLADAGANFNEFGNLPALTNGVSFTWFSQSLGEVSIHEGIKDNLEFFRLSGDAPLIVDLSGGGADAVVTTIDLSKTFGNPYGIRLKAGTKERISFTINDNLSTGITQFDIIGYGVKVC